MKKIFLLYNCKTRSYWDGAKLFTNLNYKEYTDPNAVEKDIETVLPPGEYEIHRRFVKS